MGEDRDAILARRRRFVARALTTIGTAVTATACPCLKVAAPPAPPSTESGEPESDGQTPSSGSDGGSGTDPTKGEADTPLAEDGDSFEDANPVDGGEPPM